MRRASSRTSRVTPAMRSRRCGSRASGAAPGSDAGCPVWTDRSGGCSSPVDGGCVGGTNGCWSAGTKGRLPDEVGAGTAGGGGRGNDRAGSRTFGAAHAFPIRERYLLGPRTRSNSGPKRPRRPGGSGQHPSVDLEEPIGLAPFRVRSTPVGEPSVPVWSRDRLGPREYYGGDPVVS